MRLSWSKNDEKERKKDRKKGRNIQPKKVMIVFQDTIKWAAWRSGWGLIHNRWEPVRREFKPYKVFPKARNYLTLIAQYWCVPGTDSSARS